MKSNLDVAQDNYYDIQTWELDVIKVKPVRYWQFYFMKEWARRSNQRWYLYLHLLIQTAIWTTITCTHCHTDFHIHITCWNKLSLHKEAHKVWFDRISTCYHSLSHKQIGLWCFCHIFVVILCFIWCPTADCDRKHDRHSVILLGPLVWGWWPTINWDNETIISCVKIVTGKSFSSPSLGYGRCSDY